MAFLDFLKQATANLGGPQMQQALEKQKDDANKATALRRALSIYDSENKDQYTTMGLPDLEGSMQSIALKRALLQQQQQEAQLQDYQDKRESSTALQRAVGEMGRLSTGETLDLGQGPINPPAVEPTNDRLLAALSRNPAAVNAPGGLNVLQQALSRTDSTPRVLTLGDRQFLVNPRTGGVEADLSKQTGLPTDFVPLGATVDEGGKVDIRYGPPKAEGKALTQEEVARIAALNQAETDLSGLEKIYSGLGPDYGGPVSGRVKNAFGLGQNPDIAGIQNAIVAATPNLARGVFREVGVLTDQDIERYTKLLPGPYDTEEVRTRKINQLRERIAEGRKETVSALKAAGRNVDGFKPSESKPQRFDSEQSARASGAKQGDVIELYDPATARYRKARLK